MLLFLISDNPEITLGSKFFEVYWGSTITLLMMIVPKVLLVHHKDNEDFVDAMNAIKASKNSPVSRVKNFLPARQSRVSLERRENKRYSPDVDAARKIKEYRKSSDPRASRDDSEASHDDGDSSACP